MPFRELVGTYRHADAASHISLAAALVIDTETQQVFVENGVTPGTLLNGVMVSTTILSPAQLIASNQVVGNNVGIQLLPPPGPNACYIVLSVTYCLNFGTIAYSGDGAGAGLWYGGSISVDTPGDNYVFAGSESQIQQSLPWSAINQQPAPLSILGNCPINFWSPNAPLTGGDGTGVISFAYQILNF